MLDYEWGGNPTPVILPPIADDDDDQDDSNSSIPLTHNHNHNTNWSNNNNYHYNHHRQIFLDPYNSTPSSCATTFPDHGGGSDITTTNSAGSTSEGGRGFPLPSHCISSSTTNLTPLYGNYFTNNHHHNNQVMMMMIPNNTTDHYLIPPDSDIISIPPRSFPYLQTPPFSLDPLLPPHPHSDFLHKPTPETEPGSDLGLALGLDDFSTTATYNNNNHHHCTTTTSSNHRIGLNLGGRTYFSATDDFVNRLYRRSRPQFDHTSIVTSVRCQVEGCHIDLTHAKHYHRRHKVCEFHSKASTVMANGLTQRFCQQCSRFHLLTEFDNGKRSCRRRLADHNRRRRKSHSSTTTSTMTTTTYTNNSHVDENVDKTGSGTTTTS